MDVIPPTSILLITSPASYDVYERSLTSVLLMTHIEISEWKTITSGFRGSNVILVATNGLMFHASGSVNFLENSVNARCDKLNSASCKNKGLSDLI